MSKDRGNAIFAMPSEEEKQTCLQWAPGVVISIKKFRFFLLFCQKLRNTPSNYPEIFPSFS